MAFGSYFSYGKDEEMDYTPSPELIAVIDRIKIYSNTLAGQINLIKTGNPPNFDVLKDLGFAISTLNADIQALPEYVEWKKNTYLCGTIPMREPIKPDTLLLSLDASLFYLNAIPEHLLSAKIIPKSLHQFVLDLLERCILDFFYYVPREI